MYIGNNFEYASGKGPWLYGIIYMQNVQNTAFAMPLSVPEILESHRQSEYGVLA